MILDGYFRSSASWRVRIALGLKGVEVDQRFRHLRKGEHRALEFRALNPQGLVPALMLDDGTVLTQSLAICEYLDEAFPDPPLLPTNPAERAAVRAFAQVIACDIHPIQNLKILQRLRDLRVDEKDIQDWARSVIEEGFEALERLVADQPGPFAFGKAPGLADVCLIPQMGNARRFGVDLRWARLNSIEAACAALPAFANAIPEQQEDAE